MTKMMTRFFALFLAVAILFSGCGQEKGPSLKEVLSRQIQSSVRQTRFEQMEYVRPDMEELNRVLSAACEAAAGTDVEAIMDGVYAYYDAYDWFYTHYSLADIRYCQDLTNAEWEAEYDYCTQCSAEVDSGLEQLYYALAQSPCCRELEGEDYFGAGFFDGYDGENNWDAAYTAMLEREAQLQSTYYRLSGEAGDAAYGTDAYYDAYADDMAQVLVELIALRQEMAAHWGYDSYVDFAWASYYYRDYTPGQMDSYMAAISRELVPLYRELARSDVWDYSYRFADENQTFSYVQTAARNMGGQVAEAFDKMASWGLYDISYGENKYATSFEVYLTGYQVPFVYLCPEQEIYDRLTFAHEFGHFCNDYASDGSSAGVDVLEVFSQGMEYLSLCYVPDTGELTRVKMADSLCTFVEQSAFATFEHRAYTLTGDGLSVEGLYELYDTVALKFGFDSTGYDPREFVTVSHFFTNPLYIDSYVVSNDAALQLYLLEIGEPGMGLQRYEETLDTWQEYFLAYLKEAGLTSPFVPGQLEKVRDLLAETLFPEG